jgi:hypothetical protein
MVDELRRINYIYYVNEIEPLTTTREVNYGKEQQQHQDFHHQC